MARCSYRFKQLEALRNEYKLVLIYLTNLRSANSLSCGYVSAFWVAGDGRKTVLYSCQGEVEVVPNSDFKFVRVSYVFKSMIVNGRIVYLETEESKEWKELGPIEPEGLKDTDKDVRLALLDLRETDNTSFKTIDKMLKEADVSEIGDLLIGGSIDDDLG